MVPRFRRKPLGTVVWCLAIVFASQVLFLLGTEGWQPRLGDPEYGRKLARLRARRAERPDAPMLVALGSSRVALGFRAGLLRESRSSSAGAPLVFNLGIMRCHPVGELLYLRRLLADGVQPDGVLLEIYPPWLSLQAAEIDDQADVARLRWPELRVLRTYAACPDRLERNWLKTRLSPWASYRFLLMNQMFPTWLESGRRLDLNWRGLDDWGWVSVDHFSGHLDAAAHARALSLIKEGCAGMASLQTSGLVERAYRSILDLCRERRIAVALLLMPEGSTFRSWYSAASLQEIDRSVRTWASEYGASVIDARLWCADSDFLEDVHLTHGGAVVFTRRLDLEGLPRLIATSRDSRIGRSQLAGRALRR